VRHAKELMAAAWQGELDRAATSTLNQHLETCGRMQRGDGGARHFVGTHGGSARAGAESGSARPMGIDSRVPDAGSAQASANPVAGELLAAEPVWQGAIAMAALVMGVLIGTSLPRRDGEIAKLHEEIANTREMVALSLLQQQSATERLKGVNYTGRMQTMEPKWCLALIQAVTHDASVNVRLAAVDALSKSAGSPRVLQSLTQSLPTQDSPMVQAALIDYLVDDAIARLWERSGSLHHSRI